MKNLEQNIEEISGCKTSSHLFPRLLTGRVHVKSPREERLLSTDKIPSRGNLLKSQQVQGVLFTCLKGESARTDYPPKNKGPPPEMNFVSCVSIHKLQKTENCQDTSKITDKKCLQHHEKETMSTSYR